MANLYLDDSKHHAFGFSISTFVVCNENPQGELCSIYEACGFKPQEFEFKSSARMHDNIQLQELRGELKVFLRTNCKVAVCVVNGDKKIDPASLSLLQRVMSHELMICQNHEVYFDQGLFASLNAAKEMADERLLLEKCNFHFEQDSRSVMGIQLADLAAHTCGIMLLDKLGHIKKKRYIPNSGYIDEVDLGFEMWASLRYSFLGVHDPDNVDKDFPTMAVEPFGLFIDESVNSEIATAAIERFGEVYVGCIH